MSSVFILLYRCCLRIFSPHFQWEFAAEMEEVFEERLEQAAANGRFALLAFVLHELLGLIAGGARQRAYAWQARPLLAAQTGSSVVVADRGSLWGNKALKWGALLVLIGMLLFLAFWIYMFFFFSFERPPRVQEVALGDLNGDGQLDAYLAIAPDGEPYVHPDYLLFNVGNGRFTDSGQDLGDAPSFSVALGDVNGDGLLDIVVGGYGVKVYRNYGSGTFRGHYSVGNGQDGIYRFHVALADLNRDGHLDVFGAGCCGGGIPGNGGMQPVFYPTSRAWLGNGAGTFSTTGQSLGQLGSHAAALADLNGDGAFDAFLANSSRMDASGNVQRGVPNTIWFNDGPGNFTDSGQQLGNEESYAVALGDANGDGFIDAVVGNRGPDEIWFNDGQGNFSDSGQRLGRGLTRAVFLADLDGDGDLDLVAAGEESAQVWLNDGAGQFSQDQRISYNQYEAIALGDVTGDGMVDIFVAGVESYQVWRGMGNGRFTADPRTVFMTPQP